VWEQPKKEEQHGYFGERYAQDVEDFHREEELVLLATKNGLGRDVRGGFG
jgi:hypothetical protein